MIAAVIHGANRLTVTLGVFESIGAAQDTFQALGCKWMTLREKYPNSRNPYTGCKEQFERWEKSHDVAHLFITETFSEYMASRKLPWYSTGPRMDEFWIDFVPIELNTIRFGFDDD